MRRNGSKAVSWLVVAVVTAMLSSVSFAAVNNDEVTSQKLKEADGTSGQNTNSGSGVKTGHIQNGAVTNAKIAGTISVDKLATYAGTVIVHAGPANGVDTFNSINTAISVNPVLIKVMPGVYNENVVIPATQAISIEGSGPSFTVINGSIMGLGGNYIMLKDLQVVGENNAVFGMEITLENVIVGDMVGEYINKISIKDSITGNINVGSGNIQHSVVNGTIRYWGVETNNFISDTKVNAPGTATYGIELYSTQGISGPLEIHNVQVSGSQTGMYYRGGLKMSNSNIAGTDYGIVVAGWVDVSNSSISGGLSAIYSEGPYSSHRISNSKLSGPVMSGISSELKLINCFDNNYTAIPNQ